MSEFNNQNIESAYQPEIKYPIILHQNNAISAKPPYKVLRYPNGDFIQLIDMHCRKFNDPAVAPGAYSIALFRIKPEESLLINTRPDRLDLLAQMLYDHIPADRFVRASVVRENKPYDITVEPLCRTIDRAEEQAAPVFDEIPHLDPVPAVSVRKPEPAATQPLSDIGRLDLRIMPDVLNDYQREMYVFAPVRAAREISAAELTALSFTELMSVAFVTSNCNVERMLQFNRNAKEANLRTVLNAAAARLKNNSFYAIYDKAEGAPVKLFNNGVPFTPVFSAKELADAVIYGNDRVECMEIASGKTEFFRALLDHGIVQFIVDSNPLTLSVQGYCIFMSAN